MSTAGRSDDVEYEEWQESIDAQEFAYTQALASELRRKAVSKELHARAYEECAFLDVEVATKDSKGHEVRVTRRLWDGQSRDPSTGAPRPDPVLVDRWVETQLAKVDASIAEASRMKAIRAMEDAAAFVPPVVDFHDLEELEAADLPDVEYRIDRLHNVGGSLFLAAQAKAGKTSVSFNLVRCLADGLPFLDRDVVPVERRIVYWDFELERKYAVQQMRKLGIQNKKKVSLFGLKGVSIPLHTDGARTWAIDHLRKYDAEVWFIDTLSRLFVGDEDSNTDMRRFVTALEEVQRLSGVREIYLIHHAGHSKEGQKIRARGASGLLGDFDTNVTLERVNPGDEEDTQRLMRVVGRGDFDPTIYYDWDPETKLVSALGSESVVKKSARRREADAKWEIDKNRVFEFVLDNPRCGRYDIEEKLALARARVPKLLDALEDRGVCVVEGDGRNGTVLNKKYYFVPDVLHPAANASVDA